MNVFDFDKTLIKEDSLQIFFKQKIDSFFFIFLILSILFKLRFVDEIRFRNYSNKLFDKALKKQKRMINSILFKTNYPSNLIKDGDIILSCTRKELISQFLFLKKLKKVKVIASEKKQILLTHEKTNYLNEIFSLKTRGTFFTDSLNDVNFESKNTNYSISIIKS